MAGVLEIQKERTRNKTIKMMVLKSFSFGMFHSLWRPRKPVVGARSRPDDRSRVPARSPAEAEAGEAVQRADTAGGFPELSSTK